MSDRARTARRGLYVLVPFAAILALVAPSAASAAAGTSALRATGASGIGLRLLDVPVNARADPRALIYIVDHLAPGTVIHRRIQVSNPSTSVARVALYPAAATISGGSFLGSAGHTPDELSTWTSISPGTAPIPPRGLLTATVTIRIPGNASPGERYGVVWAETRSDPSTTGGVVEVSRVGIRLYISVGPGGDPAADFSIDSLTAERSPDGQPIVVASVHNTGGRAIDISGALKLLNGPGSLTAGPFPAALGTTLAIGDVEPVTFALDAQLPAGPWDARIVLHSGLLSRSARATITFPAAGVVSAPVRTDHRPLWPYAGLIVLVLVIAALLIALRRRRQSSPPGVPRACSGAPRPLTPASSVGGASRAS